ncbi:hypothetical protein BCR33DRAFT_783217 [Rhizoclosmatium globosum]|uniref:Endonuclease/exonuclease/phosphatase domain-containing protein n=1 Tax=Rhizoclosmatium globosum TaxID=329046 RepID=A0A1Y2CKF2_9FUNG|nr:hypothetical protein BCR33DRAFT_783217 [Rhizoclosmatium globosum]|eukprot:ORY47493.1 hypothetical protein BCR33DRAFT_783217 [Rhizoclosmatium globosum]
MSKRSRNKNNSGSGPRPTSTDQAREPVAEAVPTGKTNSTGPPKNPKPPVKKTTAEAAEANLARATAAATLTDTVYTVELPEDFNEITWAEAKTKLLDAAYDKDIQIKQIQPTAGSFRFTLDGGTKEEVKSVMLAHGIQRKNLPPIKVFKCIPDPYFKPTPIKPSEENPIIGFLPGVPLGTTNDLIKSQMVGWTVKAIEAQYYRNTDIGERLVHFHPTTATTATAMVLTDKAPPPDPVIPEKITILGSKISFYLKNYCSQCKLVGHIVNKCPVNIKIHETEKKRKAQEILESKMKTKINLLRTIVEQFDLDIVALQELKGKNLPQTHDFPLLESYNLLATPNEKGDHDIGLLVKKSLKMEFTPKTLTKHAVEYRHEEITIVNIHGPLERKSSEWEKISKGIDPRTDILVGDFNICLHNQDRLPNNPDRFTKNIKKMVETLNLEDVHKKLHPDETDYTHTHPKEYATAFEAIETYKAGSNADFNVAKSFTLLCGNQIGPNTVPNLPPTENNDDGKAEGIRHLGAMVGKYANGTSVWNNLITKTIKEAKALRLERFTVPERIKEGTQAIPNDILSEWKALLNKVPPKVVKPSDRALYFMTRSAPYEKSKSLGTGGSMVARLKLKGIDGRAPPGVEPAA